DREHHKRVFGLPNPILSLPSTPNTQILSNFITRTSTKPLISLNPSIPTTKFLYIRIPCKISIGIPKPTVGLLNVEHRLLHYFLTYVLIPRSGNHSLLLDEDLEIMWRMVNRQQINWVYLIITHMRRTKSGNSKGLPYAILWTALFKYVGIDLSQADKKRLGYNHCVDTHVLNHMKRNVQEAPQQEEDAQPQEPQDQPSEQPSMHDMMQALLRIEQNQATMGNRLERIERNQARMFRKIRRVEAYTFSEDEAEDDDDDLD
ncbi:hypothetical protein PIB30_106882, partial [Stylosanthes scabra]|nr:hypothetical protein [Stylosanthes scabra]